MNRLMLSRFANYLEEIARLGSVRRAAERLNVSASAIDKQLLRAEEELGVPLFERLPRGMRLTSAGELVVHRLRGWRRDMATIQSEIEELQGLRRGEVRIAAAPECIAGFLPGALAAFRRDHARIACAVQVVHSDLVRQMVIDGQVDFGLTFSPPPMPGVQVTAEARFVPHALLPETPTQTARPEETISIDAFFAAPMVLPESALHLRDIADILVSRVRREVANAVVTNSLELMHDLVAQGVGHGLVVLPERHAGSARPGLRWLPFAERNLPAIRLSLVVPAERSISVAALTAKDCFETCLAAARCET